MRKHGNRGEDMNERTCIVSRKTHDAADLIRFVMTPEGGVIADINRKLPGRGVWVTANKAFVAEAASKNLFSRGFKEKVTVPDDLAAEVEKQLETSVLGSLKMARKAGLVVMGFDKVEGLIRSRKSDLVLHAKEAAEDGVRKLAQAMKSAGAQDGQLPAVKQIFLSSQMDLALGGHNVIHAAAKHGGATKALLNRIENLERYLA
ncbi:MAG: RNA-binding protein [Pseudomonadota bacterium]